VIGGGPTMLLNERHPIHDLIQAELRTKHVRMFPDLAGGGIRAALAAAGLGLDHTIGEQAFALADDSAREKYQVFTLVTDRRVCGRFLEQPRYDVRFAHLIGIDKRGGLLPKLYAQLSDRVETIQAPMVTDPLLRFCSRLVTVPPLEREPPARPLCAPAPDDPSGARQAAAWLGVEDERTSDWLAVVERAHAEGAVPTESAADLVARIVLHHRNVHFGRGMASGRFMSPVSMNDLSNAMVTLFGNPVAHQEQPVRALDFDSRLRSQTGRAIASSAIGLASTALLGIGWVQTARRRGERLRLLVADTGSFASYRLQDTTGRGLEALEPELLASIDVKLLEQEDAILQRRIVLGWGLDTNALLSVDAAAVAERFRSLRGEARPLVLGTARDAVAAVAGDGVVEHDDGYTFVVTHPGHSFEDVRSRYVEHLQRSGWTIVEESIVDPARVVQVLVEMGQHEAAALMRTKQTFGASFQRGTAAVAMNVDTLGATGVPRVHVSDLA